MSDDSMIDAEPLQRGCGVAQLPAGTGKDGLAAAGATGHVSTVEGVWPAAVQRGSVRMNNRNGAGLVPQGDAPARYTRRTAGDIPGYLFSCTITQAPLRKHLSSS